MAPLPFKAIKNDKQYYAYNRILRDLVFNKKKTTKEERDIIDLLQVLIEHYDNEHSTFGESDPVRVLKSIMVDFKIKAVDLAKTLKISKSLMSDILNYRRGMSKAIVRKLAEKFKTSQELFNRPYHLKSARKKTKKKAASKKSQLIH
jgi:HTH-type transcriptional regulator / antitoxin HigA